MNTTEPIINEREEESLADTIFDLLEIVEEGIDDLSAAYTISVLNKTITPEHTEYIVHRLKLIDRELDQIFKLCAEIRMVQPDDDFNVVSGKYQNVVGKFTMFDNIVKIINYTTSHTSDDDIVI